MFKSSLVAILGLLLSSGSYATDVFDVDLELKKHSGKAEKPYVAVYVEHPGKRFSPLFVWRDKYKWVRDLKGFWRNIARRNKADVDAVTSATRRAGAYSINDIGWDKGAISAFIIEVAREHGDYERLRVDMTEGKGDAFCAYGKLEINKFCVQEKQEK
ncbi:DUF2271 domain-containing protein [uncultured Pseudoteredinibacter sp.]|uniref:DUF2271 domain-containing protein n=1 Tax=uncultured Pseudoteredinibacter sp. TaxID=1641701 RepID=UPI00261782BC|nr:DUF2271 domain-containing protein [uncultured Pseudoteredinibacter sp.]